LLLPFTNIQILYKLDSEIKNPHRKIAERTPL
jgi:hypothetical protein